MSHTTAMFIPCILIKILVNDTRYKTYHYNIMIVDIHEQD